MLQRYFGSRDARRTITGKRYLRKGDHPMKIDILRRYESMNTDIVTWNLQVAGPGTTESKIVSNAAFKNCTDIDGKYVKGAGGNRFDHESGAWYYLLYNTANQNYQLRKKANTPTTKCQGVRTNSKPYDLETLKIGKTRQFYIIN